MLESLNILFFEDPIRSENVETLKADATEQLDVSTHLHIQDTNSIYLTQS